MVVLRLIGPSYLHTVFYAIDTTTTTTQTIVLLLSFCACCGKNWDFIMNQKKNNNNSADGARDYKEDWMMKEYLDIWLRYRLWWWCICRIQHAKIILCDDNNSQPQHIPLHLVHKRWTAFHSIRIPQTTRPKIQCATLLTGRWPGDPCFAMHARTTSTTECPYSCRIVDAREHSPTQWGPCKMEKLLLLSIYFYEIWIRPVR